MGERGMTSEHDWLAARFEEHRGHLRAVAYRMLGSLGDADDAVQEAWLRLSRLDTGEVANLGGWLTTVVARVSLDMLRARKSRPEEPLDSQAPGPPASRANPEDEALLADSVGLALLVVLDTLAPAERLAFVLHDSFGVPFDQIAAIVGRSPVAARQLASRARRRVRGSSARSDADLADQRAVVDAFLAAARDGDFDALLTLLDPDITLRMDRTAAPSGVPTEIRGATTVAKLSVRGGARAAQPVVVDGAVGVVVAPRGRLLMVLRPAVREGRIVEIEVVADLDRLRRLDLALLDA
jgi:RNA polymerase sigma factor (sigma-70 family)